MNKRNPFPILEASERFVFMNSYKEDFNLFKKTLSAAVSPHISYWIDPEHLYIPMSGYSEYCCIWTCQSSYNAIQKTAPSYM